jgi:hypothetical protein
MKPISSLALLLACGLSATASAQVFTVQVGTAAAPPVSLVAHGDDWRYRLGTNYPGAGWQTNADTALDSSWRSGRGGFGYADNPTEVSACGTLVTDVSNRCTTLYMRREFEAPVSLDATQRVVFTMDWDDGFVAYLNGAEIAREVTTNAVGQEPLFNATASGSHESSRGNNAPTFQPKTYDLGLATTRLRPVTNVLAIVGINNRLDSSDFIQIADLELSGNPSPVVTGTYLSIVTESSVALSGTNTMPGSARVVINGEEAAFNPAQGTWSKTQSLAPGMNRLFLAALDPSGAILASTNWDIVCQLTSVDVGGVLPGNTTWTSASGVVHVTNNLTVGAGVTLSIGPGVVVLLSPNASILARTNGFVEAQGTEDAPIFFLPADGSSLWGELSAYGTNASLVLSQTENVGGQVRCLYGGTVRVEDCILRDFPSATREIVAGVSGSELTLRRTHMARYSEIDSRDTIYLAEGCLVEHPVVDGMDIKSTNALVPVVVRRTTLRFGHGGNTDALDLGPGANTTIDRCLMHDWPDKGVSLGDSSYDLAVRGCLIYRVGKGIEVYHGSTGHFYNNTIAASSNGLHLFEKVAGNGGGHATATNNILWGNLMAIGITNGSTLAISYSDIQGGGFPGDGNLDADPLFVNAAQDEYHLLPGSPALGSGQGGVDMGAVFPVGGIPPKPLNLAALAAGTDPIQLTWQDDSDNETEFVVQRSTDAAVWQTLGTAPANATTFTDATALIDQPCFYRVRATNDIGPSRWSNLAAARRAAPKLFVGGVLASNTTWSPALGIVYVLSNVIVPTNLTLTIEAGTVVNLTNNAMLTASTGGVIRILGTWDRRVVLQRWNGTANWGALQAEGTNSFLEVHFADISGGQTRIYYDATALLEDTYFHDFHQQGTTSLENQPLILTQHAGPCTVRRCHLNQYYETLWRYGVNTIEDTLFENMNGDALDFDVGRPGSVIRRCTFAHGEVFNVDAIDLGNEGSLGTEGVLIEDNHIHDFPFDKGMSIGENSFNTTVRNCLIHRVSKGIQVKDVCTVCVYNCTITEAEIGLHGYEKIAGTGAGRITNSFNNILWGNTNAIVYDPLKSIVVVNYTDTGGTNWPTGAGNINADPLFVNPAAWDWRLQPGSPCIGTGSNGATMGVTFPVGIFVQAPTELAAAGGSSAVSLTWRDNSPSEAVFLIERSSDGAPFVNLAHVPLNTTSYVDGNVLAGHTYRYRVRGANIITNSADSGEAVATVGGPVITLKLGAGGSGVNSNGLFTLQFVAPPNLTWILETSTNLQGWLPVATNSTGNGRVEYSDPDSIRHPWRFYRALVGP